MRNRGGHRQSFCRQSCGFGCIQALPPTDRTRRLVAQVSKPADADFQAGKALEIARFAGLKPAIQQTWKSALQRQAAPSDGRRRHRQLHHDGRRPRAIVPVNRDGTVAAGFGIFAPAHIKIQGNGLFICTCLLQLQMRLVFPAKYSWTHKSYEPGLLVGLDEL